MSGLTILKKFCASFTVLCWLMLALPLLSEGQRIPDWMIVFLHGSVFLIVVVMIWRSPERES